MDSNIIAEDISQAQQCANEKCIVSNRFIDEYSYVVFSQLILLPLSHIIKHVLNIIVCYALKTYVFYCLFPFYSSNKLYCTNESEIN